MTSISFHILSCSLFASRDLIILLQQPSRFFHASPSLWQQFKHLLQSIQHQPYRTVRQLIGVTGDILGSSRRSPDQHRVPQYKTRPSDLSRRFGKTVGCSLFLVQIQHCILRLDFAARATVTSPREGSCKATLGQRL